MRDLIGYRADENVLKMIVVTHLTKLLHCTLEMDEFYGI